MDKAKVLLVVIGLAAIIYFIRGGIYAYATAGQKTVVLLNFEIKTAEGHNCVQKYLVFTDKGEYENTDSPWRFKWDSSRLQNQLMQYKGKTITLHYYGWRVPYISWYPNIYKFELPKDIELR